MNSTTPAPDHFAASSRRTVLTGAAWTVPAISLASAAPAFAASPSCIRGAAQRVSWSITAGSIDNTAKVSTGWLVRGQYGQPQMISSSEAQWFDGRPGSGSNQPDDSFISFANSASTTAATNVLVRYSFMVTGNASVAISGSVGLGYGNSGPNPQRTERQVVDITVRQGTGAPTSIAKIAHRRRSAASPYTYYPANSNSTTYGAMSRSDATLISSGYTLHQAIEGQHTYTAPYTSAPIQFNGTGTRPVYVDYLLTLDRKNSTAGVVNDDVIITPPTFAVNCP